MDFQNAVCLGPMWLCCNLTQSCFASMKPMYNFQQFEMRLAFEIRVKSEFTTKCKWSYIHRFCLVCNKEKPRGVKIRVFFFLKRALWCVIVEMWLQIPLKEFEDKKPLDKSLNQ